MTFIKTEYFKCPTCRTSSAFKVDVGLFGDSLSVGCDFCGWKYHIKYPHEINELIGEFKKEIIVKLKKRPITSNELDYNQDVYEIIFGKEDKAVDMKKDMDIALSFYALEKVATKSLRVAFETGKDISDEKFIETLIIFALEASREREDAFNYFFNLGIERHAGDEYVVFGNKSEEHVEVVLELDYRDFKTGAVMYIPEENRGFICEPKGELRIKSLLDGTLLKWKAKGGLLTSYIFSVDIKLNKKNKSEKDYNKKKILRTIKLKYSTDLKTSSL